MLSLFYRYVPIITFATYYKVSDARHNMKLFVEWAKQTRSQGFILYRASDTL